MPVLFSYVSENNSKDICHFSSRPSNVSLLFKSIRYDLIITEMWLNDIALSHSHLSNPCSNIQLTKLCRFVLWSFIYFLFPTDNLSLTCLFQRKIGDVIYLYSWTEDVSYQTTTTHGFICMVINSSFLWYYIHIPHRSFYQHNFFFIKKG